MNRLTILLCLALASPWCHAAVVVKKDGTVLYGTILVENGKEVVLSISRKGMTMKTAIPRGEIEAVDKKAVDPATTRPAPPPSTAPATPRLDRPTLPSGETAEQRKERIYKEAKAERAARLQTLRDKLGPQIADLTAKLDVARANGRIAVGTLNDNLASQQKEFDLIEQKYRAAIAGRVNVAFAQAARSRDLQEVERAYSGTLVGSREKVAILEESVRLMNARLAPMVEELRRAEVNLR